MLKIRVYTRKYGMRLCLTVAVVAYCIASAGAESLPQMRPALVGSGPKALVNLIDAQFLIKRGVVHSACYFNCRVEPNGQVWSYRVYGSLPDAQKLKDEVRRRIGNARFVPAVYNHRRVPAWFNGAVTFNVVNGKPHLRIFANQETSELMRGSDFISPQSIEIPGHYYEWIPYPGRSQWSDDPPAVVEVSITVDVAGNLKDARLKKETPANDRFGENALKVIKQRTFLPAFRDGKPVESTTTVPIYYVADRFDLR